MFLELVTFFILILTNIIGLNWLFLLNKRPPFATIIIESGDNMLEEISIMSSEEINDVLISLVLDPVMNEIIYNPKLEAARSEIKTIIIKMRQANIPSSLADITNRIRLILDKYNFDKPELFHGTEESSNNLVIISKRSLDLLQIKIELGELIHNSSQKEAKEEIIAILQTIKEEKKETTAEELLNIIISIKKKYPWNKLIRNTGIRRVN